MSTKQTLSCSFMGLIRQWNRSPNKKEASKLRIKLDKLRKATPVQFHLFAECFEDTGTVYLELTGKVEFEASPGSVTVAIPAEIWQEIGHPDLQQQRKTHARQRKKQKG